MKPESYEKLELMELGHKIRRLRVEQRLSQTQLADSLGISARYLGEVEAGKRNLSIGILSKIAKRLAIPLSELLAFESTKDRGETIYQINRYLERMTLSNLLFIERTIRQFLV